MESDDPWNRGEDVVIRSGHKGASEVQVIFCVLVTWLCSVPEILKFTELYTYMYVIKFFI